MSDLKIVTVPRDLYYHEVDYVRDLETQRDELRFLLRQADGYLAADDAEERDDPGNIRRALRAAIAKAKGETT